MVERAGSRQLKISRKVEMQVGYDMSLKDLRDFVEAAKEFPDNSRVRVSHYAGDQRDPQQTTFTAEEA